MFFSENLLNPHIDNSSEKKYRNKKIKKENVIEKEKELLIFGYSCHIFRDDTNAERLEKENGDLLIPWHDDEEYSLYLDRYDVRNLIEDKITLDELENSCNIYNNEEESLYDEERYMDLDSEEEKLNEMSEDEREIYLEIKREKKLKQENHNEEEESEIDNSNSDDSIDIVKPDTTKQRKIIEKTAKFITESSNPQIEIVIQAKQSSNPLFNFLNKNDILYPYYQRICLLMKMGIFTYSEEISNEDNEKETKINKKNNVIKSDDTKYINKNKGENNNVNKEEEEDKKYKEIEKTIPENTKLIIEKMADYIARNGSEFETLVRQKNIGDERFSFMQPWNKFHRYYKYKINKCLMDKNKIVQNFERNNDNNDYNNNDNKNKNDDSDSNNSNNNNNDNDNKNDDSDSNNSNSNNNDNKNKNDDSDNNNSNNNNNNDNDDDDDNINSNQIQNKITDNLIQIKNNNENKQSESVENKSKEMKELKAKRLLKMKEILARKKLKKK